MYLVYIYVYIWIYILFQFYKYKHKLNVHEHKHARELWGTLLLFEDTLCALSNNQGLKLDRWKDKKGNKLLITSSKETVSITVRVILFFCHDSFHSYHKNVAARMIISTDQYSLTLRSTKGTRVAFSACSKNVYITIFRFYIEY